MRSLEGFVLPALVTLLLHAGVLVLVSANWTPEHERLVKPIPRHVKAKVVTLDKPFTMPLVIPGHESQINFTLRNHGLIAAEQVKIIVPEDPDFIFTPLISEIPVLAAKSEITIPVTIRLRDGSALNSSTVGGDLSANSISSVLASCIGVNFEYK